MKKNRFCGLLLILLCLALITPASVFANSAQTIWSGVTSSGVIVEDENCPLIVEKELLTFDIPQFPSNYYRSIEEFLDYNATVTAQYTFYNPSDYTVTATLAFPFGNMPDYGMILDGKGESWAHETAEHTRQYGVQINGEPIESVLRHTYSSPYSDFSIERDLPKLRDGFTADEFFSPEMTVTKYTYQVSALDAEEGYAVFSVTEDESVRRTLLDEFNGFDRDEVALSYGAWIENGEQLCITVIGEPYSEEIAWKIYESGTQEKELPGSIVLTDTKTMKFLDYAMEGFEQGSGILESDWYNAFVDDRNKDPYRLESGMGLSYNLMRWYEYEITLAPGQRLTNTVTAPIYPRINGQYEPPVYEYSYLLSPARTWSAFGSLDIVIQTPYHLISSNQQKLEATENGYRVTLAGLPNGELEFSLSADQKPQKVMPDIGAYLLVFLPYLAIFIIPVALLVMLAILVYRVVRKHIKQ